MSETWIIESSDNQRILYITTEGAQYGEEIAIIYDGNMEHAHLLKGAPKMRDALDLIQTKVSAESWDNADEMQQSIMANEIWHACREALAEAKGETE